jgi:hypothetical protein
MATAEAIVQLNFKSQPFQRKSSKAMYNARKIEKSFRKRLLTFVSLYVDWDQKVLENVPRV